MDTWYWLIRWIQVKGMIPYWRHLLNPLQSESLQMNERRQVKEGFLSLDNFETRIVYMCHAEGEWARQKINAFRSVWNSIGGMRHHSYTINSIVWCFVDGGEKLYICLIYSLIEQWLLCLCLNLTHNKSKILILPAHIQSIFSGPDFIAFSFPPLSLTSFFSMSPALKCNYLRVTGRLRD